MIIFTVYHVDGVKFGCTKNFSKRERENKRRYGEDIKMFICESFTDIEKATKFEDAKNIEYGYKRDSRPYSDVKDMHKTRVYRPLEEEQKEKIRKSMLGKNKGERSSEVKMKIGLATMSRPLYKCPHCDKMCKGRGNLKQHINARHK